MNHELKTFQRLDPDVPRLVHEVAVLKKTEVSVITRGEHILDNSYVINAGEPTNSIVIYPEDVPVYEEILAWIKSQESELDTNAPAGA